MPLDSQQERGQRRFFLFMLLLGMIEMTLVVFITLNTLNHNVEKLYIEIPFFLFVLGLHLHMFLTKNTHWVTHGLTLAAIVVLNARLYLSQNDDFILIWLFLLPVTLFVAEGLVLGLVYSAILFFLTAINIFYGIGVWPPVPVTLESAMTFTFALLTVIVFMFFYERRRSRTFDELQAAYAQLDEYKDQLEEKVKEEVCARLEEQKILAQQSKMAAMGEMIGAIAHQWKQPLNVLSLMNVDLSEVRALKLMDDAYLDNFKKNMNEQLLFMVQTLDDFRNYFKPDKEATEFLLSEGAQSIKKLLSKQFELNNVTIRIQVPDNEPTINSFYNEYRQVILNLINNAKDAIVENGPKDRTIDVKIESLPEEAMISIQDYAGGVPSEHLPFIFEPYYTTKEKHEGTGIGLYLSKQIITQLMHGKMEVTNKNGGACFRLRLPCERKDF